MLPTLKFGQGAFNRFYSDSAVAQGIEKIIAQMTLDQSAARAVFEELGFQQEALLRDHVRDRNGEGIVRVN